MGDANDDVVVETTLLNEKELLAYADGSEDSGSDVSDHDDDDKMGKRKGSMHRTGPMDMFRRARARAAAYKTQRAGQDELVELQGLQEEKGKGGHHDKGAGAGAGSGVTQGEGKQGCWQARAARARVRAEQAAEKARQKAHAKMLRTRARAAELRRRARAGESLGCRAAAQQKWAEWKEKYLFAGSKVVPDFVDPYKDKRPEQIVQDRVWHTLAVPETFHQACLWGHCEKIEDFLDAGTRVESRDRLGRTGLLLAASEGRDWAVRLLLRNNADVNAVSDAGSTALMLAARNGHFRIVMYLMDNGAHPLLRDRDGRTAADIARMYHGFGQMMSIYEIEYSNAAPPLLTACCYQMRRVCYKLRYVLEYVWYKAHSFYNWVHRGQVKRKLNKIKQKRSKEKHAEMRAAQEQKVEQEQEAKMLTGSGTDSGGQK